MQQMLGEEYPAFLASYEQPCAQALRVNPLKGSRETFLERSPFALEPVAWEPCGFYYAPEDAPGKHPYHEAGVYYIQEPSAMAPAGYLDAQPGEKILDLCAAPGGKSTQLAAAMRGQGLLVSNEIHPSRAKILSENIERMGVKNCMVTNESPQALSGIFVSFFDKILVDAPCSGEGMFRKNEEAIREWSVENVALCADRQLEILGCAAAMLKPGGRLVYSTCTFSQEENEGTVSRFAERFPEFSVRETRRLFPHQVRGEGHFMAVLEKAGSLAPNTDSAPGTGQKEREYEAFCDQFLRTELSGKLVRFGEQLYLAPRELPPLKGLKVLRPGLHLGTVKKNRFEPSHALALALSPGEARYSLDLKGDGREVRAYLSGQTLPAEGEKGWYLITVDGYSLGWGKLAGGVMKNHYPKGLRKM
jgi:16S rRNA C967 or C1407 C5-methylase (RsmB/RsmF family)/NOL1/NOP2/fmu family ribosome biogenesis protein